MNRKLQRRFKGLRLLVAHELAVAEPAFLYYCAVRAGERTLALWNPVAHLSDVFPYVGFERLNWPRCKRRSRSVAVVVAV